MAKKGCNTQKKKEKTKVCKFLLKLHSFCTLHTYVVREKFYNMKMMITKANYQTKANQFCLFKFQSAVPRLLCNIALFFSMNVWFMEENFGGRPCVYNKCV